MEQTLYFKDMNNKDHNNYPSKIYRVEHSKILLEVLDSTYIQGRAKYFSSIRARDEFVRSLKDHILKINNDEVKLIQKYWRENNI